MDSQGGLPSPIAGVPPMLQPHVHLVSAYRYPTMHQLSLDTTVDYLLNAPKITREVSAMTWQFLEAPADGTVLLLWQPQSSNPQSSSRFASDGYIWGDAERLFNQQYKGYNVEMFVHKVGYVPPHEGLATHTRKRYRLTPQANDACDPSLWLVHYARADPPDHVPSNRIPFHPTTQQTLHQRRVLQQQGQLVRKEFMLYDKQNWPHIALPQNLQAAHQGMLPQQARPQQPYLPAETVGPSPAKRQRQSGAMQRQAPVKAPAAAGLRDTALEDEMEEQGDLFDLLTPRDISVMRFTKHTEWMEEITASNWDTLLIDPVPLGQGRKGALSSLTDGFLEAPSEASIKTNPGAFADKLGEEKMSEFTKRVNERITSLQAEMEAEKESHAKRMAEISKSSVWREAEKALRAAPLSNDTFKLEAGFGNIGPVHDDYAGLGVDQIVAKVESEYGVKLTKLEASTLIEKGGLEEKAPPPPEPIQEDTVMGDDIIGGSPNFADFTNMSGTPQAEGSGQAAPSTTNASTAPVTGPTQSEPKPQVDQSTDVVNAGEDWVMVERDAGKPPGAPPSIDAELGATPPTTAPPAPAASTVPAPSQASVVPTAPVVQTVPASVDIGNDLVNFDGDTPAADGGDLGDIDFGNESMEFGGEDSAFGDAFHHTEAEAADRGGPA